MEIMDNNSPKPVSIGDWFVTILLVGIPGVNLIMLIVWSFGANTNPNKANWAKASLIWMVITVILWMLLASTIIGLISAAALMF